jgi:hypothetical protein
MQILTRRLPTLKCGSPSRRRLSIVRGAKSHRWPKPRLSVIGLSANFCSVAVSDMHTGFSVMNRIEARLTAAFSGLCG